MTVKDDLHRLVDRLDQSQFEQARQLLEDLVNFVGDVDEEPLSGEDLASIERGTEDIRSGRTKSLDQYERERGL